MPAFKATTVRLLTLSLLLIFGGGLLARLVQSDFGAVSVLDIRFQSESGATLSALLYLPDGVSAANPAPGVLAVHGYINSRETQSPYAIELARRGYVVLNMDQRGHGYSDPPAFAEGFGGPAGLSYLRSLEFVDADQVALIGHSMGGWTVLSAAARMPDAYSSVIVSGSSTGTFGVPAGDSEFPRNFGLVFGEYDEFSATMWEARAGAEVGSTARLQQQFGTTRPVQPDRLYGDLADGTARRLYQPSQTHPANHITRSGVAPVIEWVQTTTRAPFPLAPTDQIWPYKELGTLLSLAGGLIFLFAFGSALVELPLFAPLRQETPRPTGISGRAWWFAAALFIGIPALTYFPLQGLAAALPANAWLGQTLTTGFMVWALGNTAISLVLLMVWHFFLGGRAGGNTLAGLGLDWPSGRHGSGIKLTVLLGALTVAGLYLLLAVNHALFTADMRFWVVALKLMNTIALHEFLVYVLPFTLFFVVNGALLHGQLRGEDASVRLRTTLWRNAALSGLGIALLLAYQYVPLFTNGALAIPAQALLTIVALQFVVLLPVTGLISTWFFRLTGRVYAGALVNGFFITWLIVAGQATHYAF